METLDSNEGNGSYTEGTLQKAGAPSALETVHVREIQTANFAWSLETKQLSLGFDVTKGNYSRPRFKILKANICVTAKLKAAGVMPQKTNRALEHAVCNVWIGQVTVQFWLMMAVCERLETESWAGFTQKHEYSLIHEARSLLPLVFFIIFTNCPVY